MKKSILILCVLLMAAIPSACTESHKPPPELDKPQPGPNPDPKPEPSEGKEKMLWFDAEANFQRFSTQAGIIAMLDKTQEAGFNKIGNRSGIFVAFGVRNVTFPIIVGLVIGIFGHLIYNSANDFTLCTNLISWNQTALIIHVKKRADI